MSGSDWLLLILLSIVWGGSFFFAKIAVVDCRRSTIVLARVTICGRGLAPAGDRHRPAHAHRSSLVARPSIMGLLNNAIPFSLIFWGQKEIASGLASILNATTPLFTVLVAQAFTQDEKATPAKLIGVGLGITRRRADDRAGPDVRFGRLPALRARGPAAALSYAFAGVFGRRFRGRPPLWSRLGSSPEARS